VRAGDRGTAGQRNRRGCDSGNASRRVLGDKTFGAGSIQKMIPLQDILGVNLTVAKYYSPQGKAIRDSAVRQIFSCRRRRSHPADEDETATPATDQEPKKAPQDEQLRRRLSSEGTAGEGVRFSRCAKARLMPGLFCFEGILG